MKIEFPTDREIFKGEIADYWLEDDGILVSVSKPPKRTVENIKSNIQLVKKITNNRIVPLLIYLCPSPVPDRQTRKFVNEQLPNLHKAMAMVSKPGLASVIMKFLFKLQSPPIPMKSFTNEKEARTWLKQYILPKR
jgi:hypothetical protein